MYNVHLRTRGPECSGSPVALGLFCFVVFAFLTRSRDSFIRPTHRSTLPASHRPTATLRSSAYMTSSGEHHHPIHTPNEALTHLPIPRFKPQTQQGADILAEKLNAHVLMPDFFEPADAWPQDKFPPQTDEEKAKLQQFFGGAASPPNGATKLLKVSEALKQDGAKFVGAFGFCWGKCRSTVICEIR